MIDFLSLCSTNLIKQIEHDKLNGNVRNVLNYNATSTL